MSPDMVRTLRRAGAPPVSPDEERLLEDFLGCCTLVRVARPRRFAQAMSKADAAALSLAVRRRADLLLADARPPGEEGHVGADEPVVEADADDDRVQRIVFTLYAIQLFLDVEHVPEL